MDTQHLTFTRFLAAIAIVVLHFGNQLYPFNLRFVSAVVTNAAVGVSYFFLLSGFVMAIAYSNRGKKIAFGSYIQNRAARILPLYFFALILMIIYYLIRTHIFHMHVQYQLSVTDILVNVFLLQSWIDSNAHNLNTASWTLSVEAFFYLSFPFINNRFFNQLSFKNVAIAVLAFFVVSQLLLHGLMHKFPNRKPFIQDFPLFHLNEFLVGNLVGLYFIRNRNKHNNTFYLLIVTALMLLALQQVVPGISYTNGMFLFILVPFLMLLAYDNGPITRVFSNKLLIYLGEISYGIYILQFPVYFFFTAFLTVIGHKINLPLFYVYLLSLIAISALSFSFIEKPLQEKIKAIKFN